MKLLLFPLLFLASASTPHGAVLSQQRQNLAADRHGLVRYRDLAELQTAVAKGELVSITDTTVYEISEWLGSADPENRDLYRHARPWVRDFLDREIGALNLTTGARFRVTSLVRTEDYQRELVRRGNRAAVHGRAWWQRSSHLTGATVDLGRRGLDPRIVSTLRQRLIELQRLGQVEFILEPTCFHIMVLPNYGR